MICKKLKYYQKHRRSSSNSPRYALLFKPAAPTESVKAQSHLRHRVLYLLRLNRFALSRLAFSALFLHFGSINKFIFCNRCFKEVLKYYSNVHNDRYQLNTNFKGHEIMECEAADNYSTWKLNSTSFSTSPKINNSMSETNFFSVINEKVLFTEIRKKANHQNSTAEPGQTNKQQPDKEEVQKHRKYFQQTQTRCSITFQYQNVSHESTQ